MATFYGYVNALHRKMDFEVMEKVRTHTCHHYTYVLTGEATDPETGRKVRASSLVSEGQWNKYDVPVIEREVNPNGADDRRRAAARKKSMRPAKPRLHPVSKSRRKPAKDPEIERWLMEHNGIDYKEFDDNRIIADE